MVLNISLDRCGVPPTLDEPQLSLPTWRRAEAISSCVVFTGSLLATTKTFGTDATTMIGAKSRATSKPGPFLNSSGLIVSVCGAPSTSVWPSAGARAASAMPVLPLAPLRVSTSQDWPSTACRRSAMARETMSVAPPGGKGTISRTGRLGEAGCVWPIAGRLAAAWVPAARARAFSALRRDVWLGMFIIESPSCVASVHPCATVDVERMACHVPGAAGTQVMGCICHLGRKPEAAQRDAGREFGPALLRDHGALDRARHHSVDAHAVTGQFNGQ